MSWGKLGRVFSPDDLGAASSHWAQGYASFPTAEALENGNLRVYFTALDNAHQGRTGWLEVAGDNPQRVLRHHPQPVLTLGEMGDFDECGANVFSVAQWGGQRLCFYQGWQRTTKAPYLIFTGVAAQGAEGETLNKLCRTPVLDRTPEQPYMRAAPFVLSEEAGNIQPGRGEGSIENIHPNHSPHLRMWYVNCVRWSWVNGQARYLVNIHTATSTNGLNWEAWPEPCLHPQGDEYAVGRPSVLRTADGYEMWFSVRSSSRPYHLGHARSVDGVHWSRSGATHPLPEASGTGWDSEMVCYPNVIEHQGQRFMFYNGNQHGRSGFGVARWQA
jgi:hypothetical protein